MSAKRNLLIGVGVGAALGILFAPHKGSKTRRKLTQRGHELKDGWNSLKENLTHALSPSTDEIERFSEEDIAQTPAYISSSMQDEWKP